MEYSIEIIFFKACTVFAFLLAKLNIPRPYSAKREFLNKINELRQKQKEKAEAERKETAIKSWIHGLFFDSKIRGTRLVLHESHSYSC